MLTWIIASTLFLTQIGDSKPDLLYTGGQSMEVTGRFGEVLNHGSSLKRQHFAFIDSRMPVRPSEAPVVEVSSTGFDGPYQYRTQVSIETDEPIVALRVAIVTINVWDEHGLNLSDTRITDIPPGLQELQAAWDSPVDAAACEYWASIAFVSRVRTATGDVFYADHQAILESLREIAPKLTLKDFDAAYQASSPVIKKPSGNIEDPLPAVLPPRIVWRNDPRYPAGSLRRGEEGSVLLRIHVASDSSVSEVEVVEGSGFKDLDEAAQSAALSWKYSASKKDGENVEGSLLHRVNFNIEG